MADLTTILKAMTKQPENEAAMVVPTNLGILTISMHFEPYESLGEILEDA